MKIIFDERNVEKSEEFPEIPFGINNDPESLALQFELFRKMIYSDPILATCRELLLNAIDSHTEANISNKPIEITLPNRFDSCFKVRDYGKGLSEEEMKDIYTKYFKSTRSTSNKFVGAMGLGSKSFWAVSDSAVTTSYQNGIKRIFNAYIDKSNLGRLQKIAEESTSEPDGLEVIVPVKQEDIQKFIDKTINLCKYFIIKPKILGINPIPDISHDNHYILSGKNWFYWGDNRSPIAVMGQVPYFINMQAMEGVLSDIQEIFLNSGIESLV
ncbi:MAG: ATP-binding protein [Nanoarchaeota archaeon]